MKKRVAAAVLGIMLSVSMGLEVPAAALALPLMTSAQGILPAMAVYAGGILVAWVCGFIFTTLFGCRNVNLD